MALPAYYAEVVMHIGEVASGGVVAMYWQRCILVSPKDEDPTQY